MPEDRIWYPFTQVRDESVHPKAIRAKGAFITLENGTKLIDAVSSRWVNIHGHGNHLIAKSILDQSLQLEHVNFSGFTHQPAIDYAERLCGLLPEPLGRIFYSDNGSTSVEAALKMACQYFYNLEGKSRYGFIGFEGAYHGDTIGAMSAGDHQVFKEPFKKLLFKSRTVPFPDTWDEDHTFEARELDALQKIRDILDKNPEETAGLIIEPMVQGAGGMKMCRTSFLQELRSICDEYGILLIFDEVMTGFGRTGEYFACQKAEVTPDILCLSKGITGGFLPLGVTAVREKIYRQFCEGDEQHTLFHGHAFTANPLSCAAALTSLNLLEESQQFRRVESLQMRMQQRVMNWEGIEKIRRCGTIAAFDVRTNEKTGYLNPVGKRLKSKAMEMGVVIRPLGNVVYVMPPYCISEEELTMVYDVLEQAIAKLGEEK